MSLERLPRLVGSAGLFVLALVSATAPLGAQSPAGSDQERTRRGVETDRSFRLRLTRPERGQPPPTRAPRRCRNSSSRTGEPSGPPSGSIGGDGSARYSSGCAAQV